jgi:hypothetical protein
MPATSGPSLHADRAATEPYLQLPRNRRSRLSLGPWTTTYPPRELSELPKRIWSVLLTSDTVSVRPYSSAAPHPLQRNLDSALHPFSKTREYTRAVTAAKMDRMFAKPFVGAIEGHQDGVYCLARDPRRVGVVAGGGGDGGELADGLLACV